jgi:hypothetical protein
MCPDLVRISIDRNLDGRQGKAKDDMAWGMDLAAAGSGFSFELERI